MSNTSESGIRIGKARAVVWYAIRERIATNKRVLYEDKYRCLILENPEEDIAEIYRLSSFSAYITIVHYTLTDVSSVALRLLQQSSVPNFTNLPPVESSNPAFDAAEVELQLREELTKISDMESDLLIKRQQEEKTLTQEISISPDQEPSSPVNQSKRMQLASAHAYFTYAMIVINVLCFFLLGSGTNAFWGAVNRPAIQEFQQAYRLITSMFLHLDPMHLLFNMLVLFVVGRLIETILGPKIFLLVYFVSGLTASVFSTLMNPPQIFAMGASGAIFGLFSASVSFSLIYKEQLSETVTKSLRSVMGTIALNIVNSFRPGIDIWGHLGGAVGGLIASFLVLLNFEVVSYINEDHARLEPRPNQFQALVGILGVTIILLISTVFFNFNRTLDLEGLQITYPFGWSNTRNFDYEVYEGVCPASLQCLLISRSGGVGVVVKRLEDTSFAQDTIMDFEISIEGEMRSSRMTHAGDANITVDGVAGRQLRYDGNNITQIITLFKPEDTVFVVIVADGSSANMQRQLPALDEMIRSIDWQN